MGGKTVEQEFSASSAAVYEACRLAVAELGYSTSHSSKAEGQISFNTGRSMSSWHGQDLTATIFDNGASIRVVVGGSLAKGGSAFTGGGSQLFSWGEKKKLSMKFLTKVQETLPNVKIDNLRDEAVTGKDTVSLTNELSKLADLKAAGVLTEEEFAEAKRKLIE